MGRVRRFTRKVLEKLRLYETREIPVMAQAPSGDMLKGKKSLVVGGSRGIGKVIAQRLTQAGADVIISGRAEETLNRCASEIGCKGYIVNDIAEVENHEQFLMAAGSKMGGYLTSS